MGSYMSDVSDIGTDVICAVVLAGLLALMGPRAPPAQSPTSACAPCPGARMKGMTGRIHAALNHRLSAIVLAYRPPASCIRQPCQGRHAA